MTKIGIDISLLQTAHRRRGIGYTLINFINHISEEAKKEYRFVLYHYPIDLENDPFSLLSLDGVNYEAKEIKNIRLYDTGNRGRSGIALGVANHLRILKDILLGDSRIKDVSGLDHFLQFDQNQPLPSKNKVASTLIVYDLIPYVMESGYLWSYNTARTRGRSRKNSLRLATLRKFYKLKNKLIANKASQLLAISEHTKRDFVKYLNINPKKIKVCLLGVDNKKSANGKLDTFKRYRQTSWGPVPQNTTLSGEKFLLFVGGADQRRRLIDLLAAFNNLRAQGQDIKLVLAGDTMQGPSTTPVDDLKEYLKNTSYIDDIFFLGFISDDQREWLYKNALAFVYPSLYEGFGLPILEAMSYGTPVITYYNSSIPEVGGDAAVYTEGYKGILVETKKLLRAGDKTLQRSISIKHANTFSWNSASSKIINLVSS